MILKVRMAGCNDGTHTSAYKLQIEQQLNYVERIMLQIVQRLEEHLRGHVSTFITLLGACPSRLLAVVRVDT